MANKVVVQLVDDIDGSPATETVTFGLDGVNYEIDLNDEHAAQLRDALTPWVAKSRRTGGRKSSKGIATTKSSSSDAARIREWARSTGIEVSERGRIPA
ncbi:MAG: histone-like nucleoid-structuring protein Lsr2, partial [Actinomycetota bacterium]